jgi:hypothetical protein
VAMGAEAPAGSATRARSVLLTLAAGQFLMTLDSSVMNVAIATVAKDVGTTVTGLQAAITLYQENPAIPEQVKTQASVQLAGGVPFLSDADLQTALDQAAVPPQVAGVAVEINRDARVDGLQSALTVLALFALVGLFAARRIPDRPQRSAPAAAHEP